MNTIDHFSLSRRTALKVGLCAGAFLSTAGLAASLTGCSASAPAADFEVLRDSDLPFLRALIPVLLEGSLGAVSVQNAVADTLKNIDASLSGLSPGVLKLTQQLFDVLALPVTRGPLTGIWGRWDNASSEHIRIFLNRWDSSSLGILRMGHNALLQLVMMAWYGRAESWAHCGYSGPPTV
ncbi:twin-arginine translocation pathway signal protein [Pseudomonas sp. 10B1]|uniref:twin-arginine translocation pathway signal protein n=1 Tax=unclassified Pseudomonas TaxID=196821 RepID=UPI002AB48D40|nr:MULTISPECIES: twin-arginine translocation pathway signal protein [unclassified Pseudomonas]MDY7562347.1 twin-arginine translocation pathway signal protein [Pseudomonas sp. AB6]MEA9976382.1 twin-arginine translocation pathway signal protein [Pseudomonas sp. RTS4]MEA9994729.1 twin-arginine translocation pathway signal protein [Pseudomonas sp. AA4]MEB0086392.1 twin-arginine translocation pathway signal protein [Pseudomonas sp. RTI1]MEB0126409.1 twin-arginine translocation pathway signal protei